MKQKREIKVILDGLRDLSDELNLPIIYPSQKEITARELMYLERIAYRNGYRRALEWVIEKDVIIVPEPRVEERKE